MKNSRVEEPNVETDHLESSTSGSVNLLNQSFDTRFQPTRQDVCWSGGHALLHQVVQNQPDGQVCSAYQRRHMCPVPAMEAYRECCHSSTHSSPLFHFKDGRTLTSKSFRSTFLPLVWWSYVATIQPNITPTLVQPCTVAARHTYWCSHSTCKL